MTGSVSADSVLLIDLLQAVLSRGGGQRWMVQTTDEWCTVRPPASPLRKHGWKLHVSATPLSAPVVLARTAEVLVRHGCAFKFGTDLTRVAELVGVWYSRGAAGKFITVYPRDDEQFRLLADDLHRVTAGLAGPRILSDKQLRAGSLVHYRYGVFAADPVFTDDGIFDSRMAGPDGTWVKDQRNPWFSPPAWATSPFPEEAATTPVAPESPMLGGCYRIRSVIRHANRGGIYRATDERDGSAVLIKQARAHVGAMLDGTDVRDRLRQEARMLEVLAPLSIFPARLALFAEQDHLFLVEELIAGTTLDRWAAGRPDGLVEVARRLIAAVRKIHDAGLVIRDLKPANVMVTTVGDLRMIDAEHVVEVGKSVLPAFTPAFVAPEARQASVPAQSSDCFSLGVTLFSAYTGMTDLEWIFGSASTPRADRERESRLRQILHDHRLPPTITAVIAGLTCGDPADRWPLTQAEQSLSTPAAAARTDATPTNATRSDAARSDATPTDAACSDAAPTNATPTDATAPALPHLLDRLLTDGISELGRSMTPDQAHLWVPDIRALKSDACNAWLGAAGGLSTLARASQALGDRQLLAPLAVAARWVDERLFAVPRLLPGLSFGRAGTAWALFDAATALGDDGLAARAVDLAGRLPTEGPIADITHGLSGAGLLHLHLWQNTGDAGVLRQALACADSVVRAAHRDGEDWTWPTPNDVDSAVAGNNTYGYAHGIAGVGAFLLAAAEAVGEQGSDRYWEAALGAGDTLVRAARIRQGTPVWPSEVGGDDFVPPSGQWCNGPTGIGTFLIRLWAATGEQRFADLAEQCVPARGDLWHCVAGACCGLAGVGHYLIDLVEFTGENRFRAEAEHVAELLHARRRTDGNLDLTCPPDRGSAYKDGTAGVLAFLLRLLRGGHAPWMPTADHRPPDMPRQLVAAAAENHQRRRGV